MTHFLRAFHPAAVLLPVLLALPAGMAFLSWRAPKR